MLSAAVLVNGLRRLFSSVMAPVRERFNVVFVLGGPGAGKGTQCARIVEVSLLRYLLFVSACYCMHCGDWGRKCRFGLIVVYL